MVVAGREGLRGGDRKEEAEFSGRVIDVIQWPRIATNGCMLCQHSLRSVFLGGISEGRRESDTKDVQNDRVLSIIL